MLIDKAQQKKTTTPVQEHGVTVKTIDGGFLFEFGDRSYRVLGMNLHGLDRMKVNIKVSSAKKTADLRKDKLFHIDSFDLYASRAREVFIKTSARLLKVNDSVLIREVNTLIDLLESKRLET